MSKANETNVISVYVSNEDTGYIIHRLDLLEKYKKDLLHELELLIKRITETKE